MTGAKGERSDKGIFPWYVLIKGGQQANLRCTLLPTLLSSFIKHGVGNAEVRET